MIEYFVYGAGGGGGRGGGASSTVCKPWLLASSAHSAISCAGPPSETSTSSPKTLAASIPGSWSGRQCSRMSNFSAFICVYGCRKFPYFGLSEIKPFSIQPASPTLALPARPSAIRARWGSSWDWRLCMRVTGMGMSVGTPPPTPSRAGGPSPLRLVLANSRAWLCRITPPPARAEQRVTAASGGGSNRARCPRVPPPERCIEGYGKL